MNMNRRHFTKLAVLSGGIAPLLTGCQAAAIKTAVETPLTPAERKQRAEQQSQRAHEAFLRDGGSDFKMTGSEQIVMLLYPGFAALDLVGPQYLFAALMGAKLHLISADNDLKPVKSGEGLLILPTHVQADCPANPDILFVPGGASGTLAALKNIAFIDFIKNTAAVSKYVTSVCTGSLLLAQAGLLRGKRATSHWTTVDLLAKSGAIPVRERVVWDGNIVTGGGVTAGIDFGLQMIAALRGKRYAEAIQLQAEYDPLPPFDAGSPEKADAFVRDNLVGLFAPLVEEMDNALH